MPTVCCSLATKSLENEVRGIFRVVAIKLPPKPGDGSLDPKVRPLIEADELLSQLSLPMSNARLML